MNEVIDIIKSSPAVFVATCGAEGQPHVRPFSLMLERDSRLYFCTSSQTSAYADLLSSPLLALSVITDDNRWIKMTAEAVFDENPDIKAEAIANIPRLKAIFQTSSNPDFHTFYLKNCHAKINDSNI